MDYYRSPNSDGPDYDWDGDPSTRWFYKWVIGIAVALAIAWYGISVIHAREATFFARGRMPLRGFNAVAYGVAALSGALLMHCRFYWDNVYSDSWAGTLGKIIGLAGLVGGIVTIVVRIGALNLQ